MAVLTAPQAAILKAYIESGHAAHLYPRKRVIRLHGWKVLPIDAAIAEMTREMDTEETAARVAAGM